jgi:hypothetical protein
MSTLNNQSNVPGEISNNFDKIMSDIFTFPFIVSSGPTDFYFVDGKKILIKKHHYLFKRRERIVMVVVRETKEQWRFLTGPELSDEIYRIELSETIKKSWSESIEVYKIIKSPDVELGQVQFNLKSLKCTYKCNDEEIAAFSSGRENNPAQYIQKGFPAEFVKNLSGEWFSPMNIFSDSPEFEPYSMAAVVNRNIKAVIKPISLARTEKPFEAAFQHSELLLIGNLLRVMVLADMTDSAR